jgi:hypothetical protein
VSASRAERAELAAKLELAEAELIHAKNVRALLAVVLTDDEEDHQADRLRVEMHTADVRVDLWRGVVAELRRRLGLR